VVEANRLILALARHAGDAGEATARPAGLRPDRLETAAAGRTARLRCRRGLWGSRIRRRRGAAAAESGCGAAADAGTRATAPLTLRTGRARRSGQILPGRQDHEVVVRDWVLVLLAEEALFDQQIDVRRIRVRELPLIHADRMHILQPAKDQFL